MNTDRISHRARQLSYLATACLFLVPLGALIILATGGVTNDALRASYAIQKMPDELGLGPLAIWLGVEAVRMGLLLWVIWCLRTWLVACASGAVFAGTTALHVQRIGVGLLCLAGAHIIGHPIVVAALTWGNPVGERSLSVAFGSAEVFLILAAGLVTLFGWIQSEAARLAAENESFV